LSVTGRLKRWLSNPVLLEWEEPASWSDHQRQQSYESLRKLARVLAFRSAPVAALLLAVGFWLVGRIPEGSGPVPVTLQLLIAAPLVIMLVVPHFAMPLLRPQGGVRRRIRIRERTLEVGEGAGAGRAARWAEFDAFDVVPWGDVPLLRLRRRSWVARRREGGRVGALGLDTPALMGRLRPLLRERGLQEEPLGGLDAPPLES
jgi:hypothetical protein